MPFEIVRNDICNMKADAIVNAANRNARIGFGVDSAIHKKAGARLLLARMKIGAIAPGDAAVTPAYGLDASYVIHAVTPVWKGGGEQEEQLLRQAYDRSLELARQHHCQSVAFPLLASGNHGFPKEKALQIAVDAFYDFLMTHEMQIYLVVFDNKSLAVSQTLVSAVQSFIDEEYARAHRPIHRRYLSNDLEDVECCPSPMVSDAMVGTWEVPEKRAMAAPAEYFSLEDFLRQKDAGFTETLLDLIEKSGQKNATIYKKANISKQHFSKIINDPKAKPSKATAIALALALELNLEETKDLIGRAGYSLTNSSTFDLIIRYFIERRCYNVIEINLALYQFDQSLLGS